MKKPVIDYRQFRFSKLNTPQFSHLKLLFGWIGYFALYILTENLIPLERCHVVHCSLDDIVPFCEIFVLPYVLWYLLVAGTLLYFALYDIDSFKKVSVYIIITQVVAMVIYITFPNRQDLRPDVFPRENVFTWIIGILYSLDTSSNVFPSLHVAYSLGIASVWCKKKDAALWLKSAIVIFVIFVCLSVSFIKQHSVLDILGAIPVCLLAEYLVFHFKKKKRTA